jgi:alanine racemase
MTRYRPTVATVDLAAVRHNVRALRAAAGGAQLCAVVKANAYGHGAVPVARAALDGGASWLAVSSVEEATELRDAGVDAGLLLFSEPPPAAVHAVLDLGLTVPLYSRRFAEALAAAAAARGVRAPVHLAFDTGMGRVGVERQRWAAFLDGLPAEGLHVTGTWSHLARADEPDGPGAATTAAQLDAFDEVLALLDGRGIDPGLVHVANSAATLLHARAQRPLVRAGIGLYGLSPAADVDAVEHGLRPVLSLRSAVTFAKQVPQGTPISYGHRWAAPAAGWVATVPVGYADGLHRSLTGRMEVLVAGERRPVVGTITMDMLHVWCGDDEPRPGDEVVLVGEDGGEWLRVEDWAAALDTITYELTCHLTPRVPREYVG